MLSEGRREKFSLEGNLLQTADRHGINPPDWGAAFVEGTKASQAGKADKVRPNS